MEENVPITSRTPVLRVQATDEAITDFASSCFLDYPPISLSLRQPQSWTQNDVWEHLLASEVSVTKRSCPE